MKKVWFDGSCKGNPGAQAGACVSEDGHWAYLPFGQGTNNSAEYLGLILGMEEALLRNEKEVEFLGDSEYVILNMNDPKRKIKANRDLHNKAIELENFFRDIKFTYVPREENKAHKILKSQRNSGLNHKGNLNKRG